MKEKIVAKRYADAFLGFAGESIGAERAVDELKNLKVILSTNGDFGRFLESKQIIAANKDSVIDEVLKGFSLETRQFIKLLIQKDRIKNIIDICDYVRINYSEGGKTEALLKTSYLLDLKLIKEIKGHLEKKLNKQLSLHIQLDPDLLGGVQVIIGSLIIDGSVKKRLSELRDALKSVKVN